MDRYGTLPGLLFENGENRHVSRTSENLLFINSMIGTVFQIGCNFAFIKISGSPVSGGSINILYITRLVK